MHISPSLTQSASPALESTTLRSIPPSMDSRPTRTGHLEARFEVHPIVTIPLITRPRRAKSLGSWLDDDQG